MHLVTSPRGDNEMLGPLVSSGRLCELLESALIAAPNMALTVLCAFVCGDLCSPVTNAMQSLILSAASDMCSLIAMAHYHLITSLRPPEHQRS